MSGPPLNMPLQMHDPSTWEAGWKEMAANTDREFMGMGKSARQITPADLQGTGLAGKTSKRLLRSKICAAFLESIIPALNDELVLECKADSRLGVSQEACRVARQRGLRETVKETASESADEPPFSDLVEAAFKDYEHLKETTDAEFSPAIGGSKRWSREVVAVVIENDDVCNNWLAKTVATALEAPAHRWYSTSRDLLLPFLTTGNAAKLSEGTYREIVELGFRTSVLDSEVEERLVLENPEFAADWAEAESSKALRVLAENGLLLQENKPEVSPTDNFRDERLPTSVLEATFRIVAPYINADAAVPSNYAGRFRGERYAMDNVNRLSDFVDEVAESDVDRSKLLLFMLLYANYQIRHSRDPEEDIKFVLTHLNLESSSRQAFGAEDILTAGVLEAASRSRFPANKHLFADTSTRRGVQCTSKGCYTRHHGSAVLFAVAEDPSLRAAYVDVFEDKTLKSCIREFNAFCGDNCSSLSVLVDWWNEDERMKSRVSKVVRELAPESAVSIAPETLEKEVPFAYLETVTEMNPRLLIATLEGSPSVAAEFVKGFFKRFAGNAAAVNTFIHMASDWTGTTQELIDMARLLCSDDEVVAAADSSESYVDAGTSQQTLLNV
jgi:hypothetical protein